MIQSVTLVGPSPEEKSVGVRSYNDALRDEMRKKGVQVFQSWYSRRDFWVFGRNVGVVASQLASRATTRAKTEVVHAIYGNYASRATNVVTIMDLVWQSPGYAESKLIHTLYRRKIRDTVVICPTFVVAQQVSDWLKVPVDSIRVTPLAPNPEFFASIPLYEPPRPLVLMVGDANERKNTLESIRALAGLDVDVVHLGRAWSGTEYGRACLHEAQKRGVRVVDRGQCGVRYMREMFSSASLLLYPSRDEGFGLPPLEAAACGLQSVVGDHPVFQEVMGDACVQADGTVAGIREAIRHAVASPIAREKLQARAKLFTWKNCAEQTLKAYEAAT